MPTLLLLLLASASAFPNCRAPAEPVPGTHARCDKNAACTDYCARNQMSYEFLCCDGGSGWEAIHVTAPMIFYFFWQDPVLTYLAVYVAET